MTACVMIDGMDAVPAAGHSAYWLPTASTPPASPTPSSPRSICSKFSPSSIWNITMDIGTSIQLCPNFAVFGPFSD